MAGVERDDWGADAAVARLMVELWIEEGFFVGGAEGAFALAAGGATAYVLEEGGRGPGVVLFGVAEAAFALVEGDSIVGHGFRCGSQFDDCVASICFNSRPAEHGIMAQY